jgi:hypothetical protein
VNSGTASLTILLGQGNGNFHAGQNHRKQRRDHDCWRHKPRRKLAIIATNIYGGEGVAVLLGDSTGNFSVNPIATGSLTGANFAVIRDFSGDGNPGLAFTNGTATVFTYLGNGQGGFSPASVNPNVGGEVAISLPPITTRTTR